MHSVTQEQIREVKDRIPNLRHIKEKNIKTWKTM